MRRVVGSLTTLPKRLPFVKETLRTILDQTYSLNVLYFNVPGETLKGERYVIPEDLLVGLPHAERVVLNRCEDMGSITKLLPTLDHEAGPETIIITFDDDVLYSKDLVETLVRGMERHPEACVGLGGWIVGSFPFMFQSVHDVEREVDWLEGKTSVAYRRRFLDKDSLLKHDLPPELGQHDDHIITSAISKAGAKRFVVAGRSKVEERMDVRNLDSISGSATRYLREVWTIVGHMKAQGHYTQSADICKTYGFKVVACVAIIVALIILLVHVRQN